MECINSQNHEFGNFALSQFDNALLMSFLDDSQIEDCCDNEKLSSVIRSLEAEIDQGIIHVDQCTVESSSTNDNSSHHHDQGQLEGCEESSPTSQHGLDCDWADIGMDYMVMFPSSSSGFASWCMDPCGDEMGNAATEFGNGMNCFEHFDGVSFEVHEHGSYSPFWQESLEN